MLGFVMLDCDAGIGDAGSYTSAAVMSGFVMLDP
jgi:hypothetical protein